ncbi:helix-turn-helix domain-containing protein [Endozoicomonas atrinae]|uniref:helix-turn-helix domain-containing protein n=1 Tax=Endozoicomonas atrinae TaxID=1333660 RepID=UPI003B0045C1
MKDKQRRARAAREMAGYTVAEVTKLLGKSTSTIHAWEAEKGACPRNIDDLIALCRLYGITTDWYLEGREPIFRHDASTGRNPEFEKIHHGIRSLNRQQRKAVIHFLTVLDKSNVRTS